MTDALEKKVDALWEMREWAHKQTTMHNGDGIADKVWDSIKSKHGLTPPPATTGLRFGAEIVERDDGGLDVMHGDRYLGWTGSPRVYRWQTPFYPEDDLTGNFDTRDAALSALASAPPPPGWVEPTAAPTPEKGEGDGKPEGAPADRTRLTLYPAKMCDSTRAAFDWISRHDGGAHGALFTRTLSDACAEYAASATAALARERDALRAELATVKAENERLKVAATPQPQRWFVLDGIDHRNGTHWCWRFNADGSGGRWWYDGKDDAPSAYTIAEIIANKSRVEISPTTFEPIATRKKARGK